MLNFLWKVQKPAATVSSEQYRAVSLTRWSFWWLKSCYCVNMPCSTFRKAAAARKVASLTPAALDTTSREASVIVGASVNRRTRSATNAARLVPTSAAAAACLNEDTGVKDSRMRSMTLCRNECGSLSATCRREVPCAGEPREAGTGAYGCVEGAECTAIVASGATDVEGCERSRAYSPSKGVGCRTDARSAA